MNAHRHIYHAGMFMVIGGIIYILFREPVLFTIPLLGSSTMQPLVSLPDNLWSNTLRFVVPDALWCAALLTYASTISSKFLRLIAVFLAPVLEFGQLVRLIPGTFDIIDITVYTLIIIIFILKWKSTKTNSQCSGTA